MIYDKGISVVIPNYNGSILLPLILPPLFEALNNIALKYEVIVSDDCSTDDTVTFLQKQFPQIILLQSKTNKGFSPTINKGIFIAKYDCTLLLNSDVKLTPDYFINLMPYFNEADTFGVMGRIIGWDNDAIQDGGKYPSFHGVKIKTSQNYIPLNSKRGELFFSTYLSGANALVCTQKLIKLGGFNEIFAPYYIEDVDLCLRAWRLGWNCYYEHTAICRHQTSTTIKSKSRKNFVKGIYYRNKMFLHAIHLSKGKLFMWYLQLFVEVFLHLITGRWWFFRSLKMFFLSRKKIRKSKLDLNALVALNTNIASVNQVANKILLSLNNKAIKII